MDKKLIQEIKRIKELSNINEGSINENLLSDIKHFFEIASDKILETDTVKKLKEFFSEYIPDLDTETSDEDSSESINPSLDEITSSDDDFYKKVLEGIGASWNTKTKLMMYSWRRAESGECKNNPFNTKLKLDGIKTTCCNSECVKNYPTKEDGIKATISSLINGREMYNYDEIINALKNSNSKSFFNAIKNSSWGTDGELAETIYNDYVDGTSSRPPTPIS
jgi:hypothetical protein